MSDIGLDVIKGGGLAMWNFERLLNEPGWWHRSAITMEAGSKKRRGLDTKIAVVLVVRVRYNFRTEVDGIFVTVDDQGFLSLVCSGFQQAGGRSAYGLEPKEDCR